MNQKKMERDLTAYQTFKKRAIIPNVFGYYTLEIQIKYSWYCFPGIAVIVERNIHKTHCYQFWGRATVKTCVKYYDMKVPSIDEFQLGALNILEGTRVKSDLEQSHLLNLFYRSEPEFHLHQKILAKQILPYMKNCFL